MYTFIYKISCQVSYYLFCLFIYLDRLVVGVATPVANTPCCCLESGTLTLHKAAVLVVRALCYIQGSEGQIYPNHYGVGGGVLQHYQYTDDNWVILQPLEYVSNIYHLLLL